MPSPNEAAKEVAELYAGSILDLAEEHGAAETLRDELDGLAALVGKDRELEDFLASPLIPESARHEVLETSFRGKLDDLLVDALQVMSRKGRLGLLVATAAAYRQALKERRGEIDVEVSSAVPLSPEVAARIEKTVRKFTGKKPELKLTVDPTLLGGLVLRVADRKIDGSVKTRISRLAERLLERGSEQIGAADGDPLATT